MINQKEKKLPRSSANCIFSPRFIGYQQKCLVLAFCIKKSAWLDSLHVSKVMKEIRGFQKRAPSSGLGCHHKTGRGKSALCDVTTGQFPQRCNSAEEFVLLKCFPVRKRSQSKFCMMWDLEITTERTSEPVLKPWGRVTSADVNAGAAASLKMKGSCSCS